MDNWFSNGIDFVFGIFTGISIIIILLCLCSWFINLDWYKILTIKNIALIITILLMLTSAYRAIKCDRY